MSYNLSIGTDPKQQEASPPQEGGFAALVVVPLLPPKFPGSRGASLRAALAGALFLAFLLMPVAVCAQGRFEYAAEGHQVVDRSTGLVWKRCAEGQTWDGAGCAGAASRFSFDAAQVVTANPSGWRLPTVKELFTLIRPTQDGVGLGPAPGEREFWTSTRQAMGPHAGWLVDFAFGATLPSLRTATYPVRMVRADPATGAVKFPAAGATRFGSVAIGDGRTFSLSDCVHDSETGLIWEGKAADGGFRDFRHRFTNYDDESKLQVLAGDQRSRPALQQLEAPGNVLAYVKAVNAARLCGFSDWRLPTVAELHDLVAFDRASPPVLDPAWFPNTRTDYFYWSSEPHAAESSVRILNLSIGASRATSRSTPGYVRLVRKG